MSMCSRPDWPRRDPRARRPPARAAGVGAPAPISASISARRSRGHDRPVRLVAEDLAQRRRREALGDDLDPVRVDERGVARAARAREREQLGAQRDDVVRARAPYFRFGSSPRMSQRFCVATPVGQPPVWQRWAWMQPIASIASRPTLIMSQPSANASSAASGKPSRPAPMNTTSSAIPASRERGYTRAKPSLNGSATWSVNASGAAPVPPSPPSIVTKSGPPPVAPSAPRARSQNPAVADRRLDADRQPGRVGDPLDELDQRVDVRERRVARPG